MSLHVGISGWLLGTASGANRRILDIVRAAAPRLEPGERITVLHGETFEPPDVPGPVSWRPVRIPAAPTWRRALAENSRLADIVLEHGIGVLDHALLPAPGVPCPLVWTVHDLRITDGRSRYPSWLARRAVRRACRRATTVLVPSAFTQERLRDAVPDIASEIIHNGVSIPDIRGLDAEPASYVLHVGHLEPRKNLEVLVRALAAMPARSRPLLILAGADAGAGESLRALADRLGVDDRLHLPGTVPEDELHDLYATARAVLVPSHYEGFGLCALEGLAHGRPVFVSDRGALREVTGEFAAVLPADDPEAWARAMLRDAVPDDPAIRARRRAHAEQFSWAAAAERTLACWRAAARTAR